MVAIEMKSNHENPRWLLPDENDQSVGHFHFRLGARSHKWRPPTDVYENEDVFIVRVEIAGMRDSEFSISINNKILTIEGVRSDQLERRAYHQMEIHFGEFKTEVLLHWPVDSGSVQAEYTDGILRCVLPKTKPHQVKIGK